MAAHVCSTECGCGHWKPGRRVCLPETGRRRGTYNLDLQDESWGIEHEEEESDDGDS